MGRFWLQMLGAQGVSGHIKLVTTAMIAIFVFSILGMAANAQVRQDTNAKACVPSQVAGLFVREGNAMRVNQVPQLERILSEGRKTERTIGPGNESASAATMRDAQKTFEREARNGYAPAQVNLAVVFLGGLGTPSNAGTALYWLQAAAKQGFAPAFFDLGVMYLNGCGVRQDYREAFHSFERGADAGDSAAQVNLGYLYDNGLGVAQDRAAAALWYRKAAESGEPHAQYNLGDLYLHGDGVALDEAAAFGWLQKAALQGHREARVLLGYMYAQGRGTKKDPAAAYVWLSAAVLQGDRRGESLLASLKSQLTEAQIAEANEQTQSLANSDKQLAEVALIH